MRKNVVMLVLFGSVMLGCTERVPPGYVGMVMEPSGLTGVALQPGNHSCYFRDRLILIETKEDAFKEPLSILCKDDLNFGFDLVIRTMLKSSDGGAVKQLLNVQGANLKWDGGIANLGLSTIYKTYVRPAARSIARTVVSKYDTTGIRENREVIQKEIRKQLQAELAKTPLLLVAVTTSNFDYPKVITQAVEKKRKKQIEIEEEQARQAMKLVQVENRKEIAEQEKEVRAKEAEAEAAYIAIVEKAITPAYLKRMEVLVEQKKVEASLVLYGNVGPGDKVIVTGNGSAIPMVGK